jgi:23S rRNA-/tRNA-specific pseudouridylate synthase
MFNKINHFVGIDRLGEKRNDTGAMGKFFRRVIAAATEKDDRNGAPPLLQDIKNLEPGDVGHMQVENNAAPEGRIEILQESAAGGIPSDFESDALQELLCGIPDVIVVVYDNDTLIVVKKQFALPKHNGQAVRSFRRRQHTCCSVTRTSGHAPQLCAIHVAVKRRTIDDVSQNAGMRHEASLSAV